MVRLVCGLAVWAVLLLVSGATSGFAADTPAAVATQSPPAAASVAPSQPTPDPPKVVHRFRVILITAKDSSTCAEQMAKLRQPGGEFDKLKATGWTIGAEPAMNIQIVDRDDMPELVKKLSPREYPTVVGMEDDEVARSFKSGCTTPLDSWTFGFLATGVDLRPPGAVPEAARVESTGSYRLRGNHWSVEGDWSPTRDKVLQHLRGPNHASELEPQWHIDGWSYEELRSLHDDLHERYDTVSYQPKEATPPARRKGS